MTPQEAEDALVHRYQRVSGRPSIMLRDVLHVLTHPDVIGFTRDYVTAVGSDDEPPVSSDA